MFRFVAVVLTLFLVVIGACATGPSSDVRPFSAIAESDPVIEFDPSGTAATVLVTTNQAAVCAVSYGTDGPFDAIATDQDMGTGGGHDDHAAIMTGLTPDTEYEYRLQGVGADGQLYRSEILTFTTPAATDSRSGTNVAIGATVIDVSSEFSASFAATNAIDGNIGTEWSSDGDGDAAFIAIDLGQPMDINAVSFRTRSMTDGSAITSTFTVEVDSEIFGPFPAGESPTRVSFRGQILIYRVATSSGGNTGAIEVEAFSG